MVREGYSVEPRSIQRMRLNGRPEGSLPGRGNRQCNRAGEALKSKGEQGGGGRSRTRQDGKAGRGQLMQGLVDHGSF